MIRSYLQYIGLLKESTPNTEGQLQDKVYTPVTKVKIAERYLAYLKEIERYQSERSLTIENKNAQLVGQASIVASIFSLFVPLLIDFYHGEPVIITIPLLIIFLLVLGHYLLTILHANKTLKINKYPYASRAASSVIKEKRATKQVDFLNEEIKDMIYIVGRNTKMDNKKGDNLVFAARCFEIANGGFAALTIYVIISVFLVERRVPEYKIQNLNELNISLPDSISSQITGMPRLDSVNINYDSLRIKADNQDTVK